MGRSLRFLSHAETMRVFQRALARAAIPVRYTEGFNPHPKLSLPLPRPVGVEADEELLVARLQDEAGIPEAEDRARYGAALGRALGGQLPEGMEVLTVTVAGPNASFQPRYAEYVLPLRAPEDPDLADRLKRRMAELMSSEDCPIERTTPGHRGARRVDVRPFLDSIRLEGGNVVVRCVVGAAGSVRIEEIMHLLAIQRQDLAGPVRRTKVLWETTQFNQAKHEHVFDGRVEDVEDGT